MAENDEKAIQAMENAFPALASVAFSSAHEQALAFGLTLVQSENGTLFEVHPDGSKIVVDTIAPPVSVTAGQKIRLG